MSTTRRFDCIGAITLAQNWPAVDGGDVLQYIFSEGAWVPQWIGYYHSSPKTLGTHIVATLGSFWEVPQPEDGGDPPFAVLQSTIQALIDGGATILTIGGSISGSAPGDIRIHVTNPASPTTLAELAAMQWDLEVISTGPGPDLTVTFAKGQITLDVPDIPPLEIIGEGGVDIAGDVDGSGLYTEGFPVDPYLLVGSGGIVLGGTAPQVLSKDMSGIYTLVKNKTNDTLYNRTAGGSETSEVVKIPNPFIRTGFFGG